IDVRILSQSNCGPIRIRLEGPGEDRPREETHMSPKRIWSALAILVLTSISAWAALNGDIEGVVKDSSGALVPSAMVKITNVETGAQRSLISDERGYFIATLLPIGIYQVTVELA